MSSFLASRPGAAQVGLGVALLVERKREAPSAAARVRSRGRCTTSFSAAMVLTLSRTKAVKPSRKSSGLLGVAVAARDRDDLVGMMRDRHVARRRRRRDCQSRMGPMADRDCDPVGQLGAGAVLQAAASVASGVSPATASNRARASSGSFFRRRRSLTTSWSRMVSRWVVRLGLGQLVDQLLEADRRIDHDRLHLGEVLQVRIEVHGVEDAEDLLADLGAQAGRPPDHLLIEDAAVDPAQEDEVGDRRHVDAGGQQVDRHGDLRIGVVAEGADQVLHLVDAAGDLLHRRVVDLAVGVGECLLDRA